MAEPVTVLPNNATPWMRAVEAASAARRMLPSHLIKTVDDPWTCPPHLLIHLAYQFSVDIWNEAWPLDKKRAVIANAIIMARMKGTEEGLRRYVDQVEAKVLQVITPPQGFFASEPPTKDEIDAYVRRLPQLRLYLATGKGHADGLFADQGFADNGFVTFDMGPALNRRRATLFRNGVNKDLNVVEVSTETVTSDMVKVERISVPGNGGSALFADAGFADRGFSDAVKEAAQLYTIRLDQTYTHEESSLRLSTLTPGLEPVNPRFERGTDKGKPDFGFYADVSIADRRAYAVPDRGRELMFDLLYLFDPTIQGPLGGRGGYADVTRIGMEAFTAEVLVDATRKAKPFEGFSDGMFADEGFCVADDMTKPKAACDAINVSKSLSDRVLVSFQTTRPITLNDGIDLNQGNSFEARVPRQI